MRCFAQKMGVEWFIIGFLSQGEGPQARIWKRHPKENDFADLKKYQKKAEEQGINPRPLILAKRGRNIWNIDAVGSPQPYQYLLTDVGQFQPKIWEYNIYEGNPMVGQKKISVNSHAKEERVFIADQGKVVFKE